MGATDHDNDLRADHEAACHRYTYGAAYGGWGLPPADRDAFIDVTPQGFALRLNETAHGPFAARWQAERVIADYQSRANDYELGIWLRSEGQPLRSIDPAAPWFGEPSEMLTPDDLDVFVHRHDQGAVGVAYADQWVRHFDSLTQAEQHIAGYMEAEQDHRAVWVGPSIGGPWEPYDMQAALERQSTLSADLDVHGHPQARDLVDVVAAALPEPARRLLGHPEPRVELGDDLDIL